MHMKDAMDKLIKDFKAYAGEHGSRAGCVAVLGTADEVEWKLTLWVQGNELERYEGHARVAPATA